MNARLLLLGTAFSLSVSPATALEQAEPCWVWTDTDGKPAIGRYSDIPSALKPGRPEDPDKHPHYDWRLVEPASYHEVTSDTDANDFDKLKGLIRVEKKPKKYVYLTGADKEIDLPVKLKGVKDLRSYEEAHPKRFAFQEWCKRWEGPIGLSWLIITAVGAVRKRTIF